MLEPLDRKFNIAVLRACHFLMPGGFNRIIDKPKAPATLAESKAYFARHGKVGVWTGASDKTIFGSENQGVNHAFRAWHDYCHILGDYDFSMRGEINVAMMQQSHMTAMYGTFTGYGKIYENDISYRFGRLVWAEVVGQGEHLKRYGEFPLDQHGFVRAYLYNEKSALERQW